MSPAPPTTLFQQFEITVTEHPRRRAVGFFEGGSLKFWNYEDLRDKAVHLSEGLAGLGLRKGDRLAILSQNGPEWPLIDLAAARLGLVFVPIHATLSPDQIKRLFREARIKALALGGIDPSLVESVIGPAIEHIILFDRQEHPLKLRRPAHSLSELIAAGEKIPPERRRANGVKPDDISSLIGTSGTTGEMRFVQLTHRNLVENALAGPKLTGVSPRDVCLSVLPLSHSFERIAGLWVQLFHGCAIVYGRGLTSLLQDLQAVRPTWFAAVPRLLEKAYQGIMNGIAQRSQLGAKAFAFELKRTRDYRRRRNGLIPRPLAWLEHRLADRLFYRKIRAKFGGRVTRIISGGATLDPQIAEFFTDIGMPVLEGYGLTEAAPMVSVNPIRRPKPGSVGVPLPNVRVRLGQEGEILVQGPNVMKGYEGNPDATRQAIDDEGWLHTGDLGAIDEDGYLYIRGRAKEILVTSYGKNVSPTAVEKEIEKSPFIKQAMVAGDGRPYLVGLIVPDEAAIRGDVRFAELKGLPWADLCAHPRVKDLIEGEIRAFSKSLGHHEQVQKCAIIPEDFTEGNGMLTPTLKLRRKVISKVYGDLMDRLYG